MPERPTSAAKAYANSWNAMFVTRVVLKTKNGQTRGEEKGKINVMIEVSAALPTLPR